MSQKSSGQKQKCRLSVRKGAKWAVHKNIVGGTGNQKVPAPLISSLFKAGQGLGGQSPHREAPRASGTRLGASEEYPHSHEAKVHWEGEVHQGLLLLLAGSPLEADTGKE